MGAVHSGRHFGGGGKLRLYLKIERIYKKVAKKIGVEVKNNLGGEKNFYGDKKFLGGQKIFRGVK